MTKNKELLGPLILTPRDPEMENEKVYGAFHTYGGISSPHDVSGVRPSLTNQYNDNGITLFGWYRPEYPVPNDFLRFGCVCFNIRPKDTLPMNDQILLTVNFVSHKESNIKLFLGMELIREELRISGEHNIAILADRPDVYQIDFFLKPEPTSQDPESITVITFTGAEIYTI